MAYRGIMYITNMETRQLRRRLTGQTQCQAGTNAVHGRYYFLRLNKITEWSVDTLFGCTAHWYRSLHPVRYKDSSDPYFC